MRKLICPFMKERNPTHKQITIYCFMKKVAFVEFQHEGRDQI